MTRPIDDRASFDRDRDREHTPISRHPRYRSHLLERRHAARVRIDPSITAVSCPACNGHVFVPADSDREVITCADPACGQALITKQAIDGVTVVLADQEV